MRHDWMAVDGGPGATVCHMWCANCGTLWAVADMQDPSRTNRYFIVGWAPETDASARPEGVLQRAKDVSADRLGESSVAEDTLGKLRTMTNTPAHLAVEDPLEERSDQDARSLLPHEGRNDVADSQSDVPEEIVEHLLVVLRARRRPALHRASLPPSVTLGILSR